MRLPRMLHICKVAGVAAVVMMTVGTVHDSIELRGWALLVGMLSASLGVASAVRMSTEAMKAYVHRWTLETFEHGFRKGIEQGREIEAAERFIASTRDDG